VKFRPPPGESEESLKIAPMVDTVFILLSFFIMATMFLKPERDFSMGYRKAELAPGAAREDFPSMVPVVLRRTEAGVGISIGQSRLADNDYGAIRAKLADINLPGVGVVVFAEPALSVDQVARALDAALASPMKQVSVARLRGPPAGAE
jgi:biopolymer transport protein ExbD